MPIKSALSLKPGVKKKKKRKVEVNYFRKPLERGIQTEITEGKQELLFSVK